MPAPLAAPIHRPPPAPVSPPAADRPSPVRVLLADPSTLPRVAPVWAAARDLPPATAVAAARAAGCPDLFLVAAGRADRARVVTALVAAPRAGRVLVLTPDRDMADGVVEALALGGGPDVVRALAPGEPTSDLPPAVAARTSDALGHGRVRHMRAAAEAGRAAAVDRLGHLTAAADALARLVPIADRLAVVDAGRHALAGQRDGVAAAVHAPAADDPFAAALATLDREADATAAKLRAERDAVDARRQAAAARHPAADGGRKSGLFARLFGRGAAVGVETPPPVEADDPLPALDSQAAHLRDRLAAAAAEHAAARDRLLAAECDRRRAALDERGRRLDAEAADLRAAFARDAAPLAVVGAVHPDASSLATAATALDDLRREQERRRDAAEREIVTLDRTAGDLARGLLSEAAVVVGPPDSLGTDPATDPAGPFDLLVYDRADAASDADLHHAAGRAGRWVWLGRPPANESRTISRHGEGDTLAFDFFSRAMRRLDREPWAAEGDRLVCRLSAADHRAVWAEPLLDRPDIELRFADGVDGPTLVEVAFPAGLSAADARRFLFAELGTALPRPVGECHTHVGPDDVTVCWPAADRGGLATEWVELQPGVREKVVGSGASAFTGAVEFRRSAGWNAESAEAWLADHLPADGPSRVAVIDAPSEELLAVG